MSQSVYQSDYERVLAEYRAGKPRTAAGIVDSLYALASAAADEDEMVRALAYRASFAKQTEEDGTDAAVRLLRSELERHADKPVVAALLNYQLGHYYFNYAQYNGYRLRNVTAVDGERRPAATVPLADWNLTQLATAAEDHFYRSLALARENGTRLQAIPAVVSNLEPRLAERPTLYDLLARNVLESLRNPLLSVRNPRLPDPERYLSRAAAFVNLPLPADTSSSNYHQLRLYRELINFHLAPPSPALLSADLDRLAFVRQLGVTNKAYYTALERMSEDYAGVPGSDRILLQRATALMNGDTSLAARPRTLALSLLDQVQDTSAYVRQAATQLRAAITKQEVNLKVETVVERQRNILLETEYRNLDRVYLRLYPIDGEAYRALDYQERADFRRRLLTGRPVAAKDFRLPAHPDYGTQSTELWLPRATPGDYLLLAGSERTFDPEKGPVAETEFQVSGLAVYSPPGEDTDFQEVVDRTTGAVRPGVTVTVRQRKDRRQNTWSTVRTLTSDARGRIPRIYNRNKQQYLLLEDERTDDRLRTNPYYNYQNRSDPERKANDYVHLFTDRGIYRPGQTVHVYGLAYRRDKDQLPTLRPGAEEEITLVDANGQPVGEQTATADDFGRFSLSFRLPTGGLTGVFRLRATNSNQFVRVEEYKRPRFLVELDPPAYAVAGEVTTVPGTAKLYAGPGLDDARVNYRVFLEEISYYWWQQRGNDRELIADGETTTDGDGAFNVTFTPEAQQGRRRYRYAIEVDVADATGETHAGEASVPLRSDQPVIGLRSATELVEQTDSLLLLASGSEETTTIQYTITQVTKPGVGERNRPWSFPDTTVMTTADYRRLFPELATEKTPDLAEWPASGTAVAAGELTVTDGEAKTSLPLASWPVGHYRIDFTYPDGAAGEPSTFAVFGERTGSLPPGVTVHLIAPKTATVGEPVTVTLLTAATQENVNALFTSRTRTEQFDRAVPGRQTFTFTPTEADRGGLNFAAGYVRNGRVEEQRARIALDWTNKQLKVDYQTFRDKLRPGAPERWTVRISNADGSPIPAAALATMYDASLDQIAAGTDWGFSPWPVNGRYVSGGELMLGGVQAAYGRTMERPNPNRNKVSQPLPSLDLFTANDIRRQSRMAYRSNAAPDAYDDVVDIAEEEAIQMDTAPVVMASSAPPPPPSAGASMRKKESPPPAPIRKKLQETAFWLPDLKTAADGSLTVAFDSPEALTSWKFRLFVHDKELASAVSTKTIVTQKELMVLPNVPRFVREGDRIALTARLNNLTDAAMDATVRLELFDPATDQALSAADRAVLLGAAAGADNGTKQQRLEARAGASVRFDLNVPDGRSAAGPIGYRIIARAGDYADGEENAFPVLSDRTLVTVAQPFYLKRKEKKTVTLPGLAATDSPTLRHVGYTFQATTNPAWLALKALPYLMEYPYDCTEQLANRYFANQLAYETVSNKPVLEQVFRAWERDSNALQSELTRNATLKNALLTETPWVRAAASETEQRARIGQLFDLKRLADEQAATLAKLTQRQSADGSFPWFPGGRENRYVTQYVVETGARLRQLGLPLTGWDDGQQPLLTTAVRYLDLEYQEDYARLLKRFRDEPEKLAEYRPSSAVVHYLYARQVSGVATNEPSEALTFFRDRAAAAWLSYGLYEQALLAITDVLRPGGDQALANRIITSLRERALHKDEFGMYWKYGRGYVWQNLPIETHCRILEAFRLAGGSQEELDDMRLWLLTNKRTSRWPTTKATAAAVYALLNTGTDWTTEPGQPIVATWQDAPNGKELERKVEAAQSSAEAATGSFSVALPAAQTNGGLASVRVRNPNNRLVWGGVYWQYTEVAARVQAAKDGPLTLERELFRRVSTPEGVRLEPLTDGAPLAAGDRVTVRLIVRSDRDLDFVHLKDRRAATFEPTEQLSGYRYDNGVGYYFAPGDLATNFFFDRLPKGVHTLEYDLFATHSGTFSNGLGRVQCMYAPEFGANTDGAVIRVE